MALATITQMMDGLESRLDSIAGLRTTAYLADQVVPPHAVVQVPNIDSYRETFNQGSVIVHFSVWLFVSAALDRVGQKKLAEFISPTGANSIQQALESTSVAISNVNQVVVQSFRNFNVEEVGLLGFYGGEFDVLVTTGA